MRPAFRLLLAVLLLAAAVAGVARAAPAALNLGHYERPKDFTLRITDPFPPDNPDLVQPVVGAYSIKVLPESVEDLGVADRRYLCAGLYFKQARGVIYVDVRKPSSQLRAGYYDLSVSLSLPAEGVFVSRQRRAIRYVDSATDVALAIDNSDSMKKTDPQGLRYTAAENFLRLAGLSDKINRLAIIRFASNAKVALPWTKPTDVRGLIDILRQGKPGNFTNINEALQEGARLFEDSVASEKVLILMTDGKNEPGRYRDTHQQLKEQGVRIITIGLSDQADFELLDRVAEDTGGVCFKAVDDEKLLRIYNQIASEIGDFRTLDEGRKAGEARFYATGADEMININVYGFAPGSEFRLEDPKGRPVDLDGLSALHTQASLIYRIVDPVPGEWRLRHAKGGGFRYEIMTASQCFLKLFPLERKYLRGEVAQFAASLARLDQPMRGAKVEGFILDSQNAVADSFTLFDDGVHGDNHADDGVYGAIRPVDLAPGQYSLVAWASGQDQRGDLYTRQDRRVFQVLEGAGAKDYFMASVLPLYLDLGQVEAGSAGTASLRLSFEGRRRQKVAFLPGGDIAASTSAGRLPWTSAKLPPDAFQEPSVPAVYGVRFGVPSDAVAGAYATTIRIAMEGQEIAVPVQLEVVPARMRRQDAALALRPAAAPAAPGPAAAPAQGAPASVALADDGRDLFPDGPAAPAPARLAKETKAPRPPAPAAAAPVFAFTVLPEEEQAFAISRAQVAATTYTVVNTSSSPGRVSLLAGEGDGAFDRDEVMLQPGERAEVGWTWTPEDGGKSSAGRISLRFQGEGTVLERSLAWTRRWSDALVAFLVAVLVFGASTVWHGLAYARSRRGGREPRPSQLFLSLSSFGHLLFVVAAFLWLVPPRSRPPAEDSIEFQVVDERSPEFIQEIIPEPEKAPAEQQPAKDFRPVLEPERRTAEVPQREVAPRPVEQEKSWRRSAVQLEYVAPEPPPLPGVRPVTLQRQERVERVTRERPRTAEEAAAVATEKAEAAPDRQAAARQPQQVVTAPGAALAREAEAAREKQVEREFTDRTLAGPEKSVVLSVNDRPGQRAVLKKTVQPRPEPGRTAVERVVGAQDPQRAGGAAQAPERAAPSQEAAPREVRAAPKPYELREMPRAIGAPVAPQLASPQVARDEAAALLARQAAAPEQGPRAATAPAPAVATAEEQRRQAVQGPAPRQAPESAPGVKASSGEKAAPQLAEDARRALADPKAPQAATGERKIAKEAVKELAAQAARPQDAPRERQVSDALRPVATSAGVPERSAAAVQGALQPAPASTSAVRDSLIRRSTPAGEAQAKPLQAWEPKAEAAATILSSTAPATAPLRREAAPEALSVGAGPERREIAPRQVGPETAEATVVERAPEQAPVRPASRMDEAAPVSVEAAPLPVEERETPVERSLRTLPTRKRDTQVQPAPLAPKK